MSGLPAAAGIGFKPVHFAALRAALGKDPAAIGFIEVHAETYMGEGGLLHAQLAALRQDLALSLHGIGLSIGGPDPLDRAHLARLRRLCDRYQPESFSEHLAWSSHGGGYLADLLPLPYTSETLGIVADHVDEVQQTLGRRMLLENPATYVLFEQSSIPEGEFLAAVAERTGCGLLLDLNNLFVSATNHRRDVDAMLAGFPLSLAEEIHLAGHAEESLPDGPLLIDNHASPVADPVWALLAEVVRRVGPLPTLIEWDNDVPDWPVLAAEAERATAILRSAGQPEGPAARTSREQPA
ncbi:Uncharacterized protein putative in bacteria [Rubellimicrobium thermophilum DSM 16684]|uniref:UPF0276 protein ruthe_00094 n=1 Tax=Rubellimicrobium thermophilum DSM 16684 TaxID=1123069 RepID=S9SN65_9RHOB|nr:DUF692 domain-containing protein [Rubellimicrobium thermophilum]EPX87889.1 Uncharacterized protein putative in bacteria [Rubellimicrobium thermophilum DSM 16684]